MPKYTKNAIYHTEPRGSDWTKEGCDARYTLFSDASLGHSVEVFHSWRDDHIGIVDWNRLDEIALALASFCERYERYESYVVYDKEAGAIVDLDNIDMRSVRYESGRLDAESGTINHKNEDPDYLMGVSDYLGDRNPALVFALTYE